MTLSLLISIRLAWKNGAAIPKEQKRQSTVMANKGKDHWEWLLLNKEGSPPKLSNVEDRKRARDFYLSYSFLASSASAWRAVILTGSFGLSPAALLLAAFILLNQGGKFHRLLQDAKRESEAKVKVAQLLAEHFLPAGGQLYSPLQDNCLRLPDGGYIDIFLSLPDGQSFAISVKSLKGAKDTVFYDNKAKELRYRNRHGKQRWSEEPISELKSLVELLLLRRELGSTAPTMIVVFPSPVQVKVWENVAVQVGELEVLQVGGVYLIEENNLVALINLVSQRKFPVS